MHELYLAECILRTASRSLPPAVTPHDVQRVCVRVGKLDAVVPDSLRFLFDAIKGNYSMPDAELSIEEEGVSCRCTCGHLFEVAEPLFRCPVCGSGNVKVVSGRGLVVQSITVKDEEGD